MNICSCTAVRLFDAFANGLNANGEICERIHNSPLAAVMNTEDVHML